MCVYTYIYIYIYTHTYVKHRASKQGTAWSCAELHRTAWGRLGGANTFLYARARGIRQIPRRGPSLTSSTWGSLKGEVHVKSWGMCSWETDGRRSLDGVVRVPVWWGPGWSHEGEKSSYAASLGEAREMPAAHESCRDRRQCTLGDPFPQRGVQPRGWAQWVIQSLGTTPGPRSQLGWRGWGRILSRLMRPRGSSLALPLRLNPRLEPK